MSNNNNDIQKKMPKKRKMSWYIPYIILCVLCMVVGVWGGYVLQETADDNGNLNAMTAIEKCDQYVNLNVLTTAIKQAVVEKKEYPKKGLTCGFLVGMIVFAYYATQKDKRFHRKGEEHGSARWGTEKEKAMIADTNDFYNNVILASDMLLVVDRNKRKLNAQKNKKTNPKKTVLKSEKAYHDNLQEIQEEEIISVKSALNNVKSEKKEPMLNLNAIVLGGSGTGKSRFYVEPNLMQCNTSFVVTDPSGELLTKCGKMLERMGYRIKVFNIDKMAHSHNYNPFRYIKDENGEISQANVIKMIDVLMANTKGEGEGGDPFWDNATKLLLSAICFLLIEIGDEDEQNFPSVLDMLHKANVNESKPDEKSELDIIFENRAKEEPNALSVQFYGEFKQAAGKTMQSILISTSVRLRNFKVDEVKNLTSTDNIELETIGDVKTALFIIIPSSNKTNNFLAAMMYTQLFDSLYSRAIHKYGGKLPVHTRFLLDEFANIGKIPDFEMALATMRKFEISAVIILQNITQLKRLYEKGWEELPGNCDTMIYLGGKDQFTNEYIMKELGKETIDTLAINKTKSRQGSTSYNDGIMGRELMQLNELSTMDNSQCIVMVRGFNPFITEKFELKQHPRYGMLDEANPEENTFDITTVVTKESPVPVTYEEFFDDNDYNYAENIESIKVKFMSDEDEPLVTVQELANVLGIPKNISGMFEDLKLSYSTVKI